MKELNIDEIRLIQLGVLKKVATYCEDNNLAYSLCGGTLLGAVRHKGYIPWDDDIDIMMPRLDYEKLIESYNDEELTLFEIRKNKKYDKPFAKIADNKTILKENTKTNYEIGVNIDIFPVDGFPSDSKLIENHVRKIKSYYNLLVFRSLKTRKGRNMIKNTSLLILQPLVRLIPKIFFMKRIVELAKVYDFEISRNAGIAVWGYGTREVCPKHIFEEYIMYKFEEFEFKGIKDFDTYLTNVYGDYMKLPPEEKRVTHHDFRAFLK